MNFASAPAVQQTRLGSQLRGMARRLETVQSLDTFGDPLARTVRRCLGEGPTSDFLAGAWLGHALHPLLTDFPLGMWIGTSVLDLFGGQEHQRSADALLLGGILTALPTAAAGLRDWAHAAPAARRVGLGHAAANSTALTLYMTSLACRRRGHRSAGVAVAVVAGVVANVGGYLGGHLTLVMGVTTARAGAGEGVTA